MARGSACSCPMVLWLTRPFPVRHNRASKSLDHKFLERRIDPDGLFIAGVIKMTLK